MPGAKPFLIACSAFILSDGRAGRADYNSLRRAAVLPILPGGPLLVSTRPYPYEGPHDRERLRVVGVVGVLRVSIDPEELPEYLEAHQDQHQCYDLYIHTPLKGVYMDAVTSHLSGD